MKVKFEFEIPENAYGQPCRTCIMRALAVDGIYCMAVDGFVPTTYYSEEEITLTYDELHSECPLVTVDE